jgi:hypothetical protein
MRHYSVRRRGRKFSGFEGTQAEHARPSGIGTSTFEGG